jgi:hypothetical protein
MSARLSEEVDIVLRRYHVSMTPAHPLAAHLFGHSSPPGQEFHCPPQSGRLRARYAAKHSTSHARFGYVSRKVEDGLNNFSTSANLILRSLSR